MNVMCEKLTKGMHNVVVVVDFFTMSVVYMHADVFRLNAVTLNLSTLHDFCGA